MEDGEALGVLEIDRETLLVARSELPPVIGRLAGHRGRGAPRIAGPRRFDLDHLGAEVREDRRRRGSGDPARAVDDFQALENIGHRRLPLSGSAWWRTASIAVRASSRTGPACGD